MDGKDSLKTSFLLKSKKKIIITILGTIVLISAVVIGVSLSEHPQKTKVGASGVILNLTSTNPNPKVGNTFVVAASMDTQGLSVSGADIKITYDPNVLTAIQVTVGDFLPTVLVPGKVGSGEATIVVGCLVDTNGAYPKTGTGLLAQITFSAKTVGSSTIKFDPATIVAAVGQNTSVVGTLNSVSITVAASATPTPTPTPTPTLTPTNPPTTAPSATPTLTPNSSTTPTATPACPKEKQGDINCDGSINIIDLGILIDNYGKSPVPNPKADLNGDGVVNIIDIGILVDYYGK